MGLISNYLTRMRNSDERVQHRSVLTISIILSLIILPVLFFIFKSHLFNGIKKDVSTATSSLESPSKSFSDFFKDAGGYFSSLRSNFSDFTKKVEDAKNVSTIKSNNTAPEIVVNPTNSSATSTFVSTTSTSSIPVEKASSTPLN